MPLLAVNGTELYYESHGSGPVMVLAHGVGGNHAIWFNQIAWFAKTHRVITFDHRGFGNSTDPEQKGRSAYTDDLAALLSHLEVDSSVLVGQSMGGGTCVGYARLFPQRVRALVLADTLHGLQLPERVARIMQQAKSATEGLGQIERVLGARTRQADPARAELYRQINSFNATNRHSITGAYPYMLTPAELGALGVPVLFIAGEEDVLFPVTAIKAVQEQVAGSEWTEVTSAGHSAFYEQPEQFNRDVADFLRRRVGS
jgi:pimeloyl-ACP methyl ester carboxylesterase